MRIFLYDNFMTNGFYYIGRRASKPWRTNSSDVQDSVSMIADIHEQFWVKLI